MYLISHQVNYIDMITVDNQYLNRIANVSSPSQAQYPLEALRVPLYQALSTPGCDHSSVSSSMVSLSVDDDDDCEGGELAMNCCE